MKKRKILVITTGGTIAAVEKDGVRVLGDMETFCHNLLDNTHFENVSIDVISPLNTFSENMTIKKWQVLLQCIKQRLSSDKNIAISNDANEVDTKSFDKIPSSDIDGIIITHGSDTMAYTASMLSFATQGLNIPIVLVASSQPIIGCSDSNGNTNFSAAVHFITGTQYSGTFVAYSYNNIDTTVYVGERVLQSQSFVDRYATFGSHCDFGVIDKDGKFDPRDVELCKSKMHKSNKLSNNSHSSNSLDIKSNAQTNIPLLYKIPDIASLNSNILIITPHVGMDFSAFSLEHIDTVVINPYHSATYCWLDDSDDKYSIQTLCKKCEDRNIPIMMSPCRQHAPLYNSSKNNIIRLCNISLEATYSKILWANSVYEIGSQEWLEFLNKPICNEFV